MFKYLRYSLFSRHRRGHGIHSPFVFDLITRVLRNKTDSTIVLKVELLREQLLSDKRKVYVEDHGVGSAKMKSNTRRVSDIARYSSVGSKYGLLLANMSNEFGKESVIELGTSLGISTMYLALSNKPSIVYTVEGAPELAAIARNNFEKSGIENVISVSGTFEERLPELLKEVKVPGLVFIDGNHRKEPVLDYFNQIADTSGDNTVVIVDDIYNSPDIAEAWGIIKNHEKVSVSVDVFRMGMLFFRKGMSKENYIIRY